MCSPDEISAADKNSAGSAALKAAPAARISAFSRGAVSSLRALAGRRSNWFWGVAGGIICLGVIAPLLSRKGNAARTDAVPGLRDNILHEIGSIEASKEITVLARFSGEIVWKIEEGTFVEVGEPVVKFGTKPPATTIEDDIAEREKDQLDKKDAVRIAQAALALLRHRNRYLIRQQEAQFKLARLDCKLLYDAPRPEERRHMELVLKAADLEKQECEWETKGYEDLAKLGFVSDAKLKEQQYLLAGKVTAFAQAQALYDLTIQGTPVDIKRVADLSMADARKKLEATRFNCAADLNAAKATLALAKIDLANCERDLKIKRRDFERATVRAPIRGRVAFVDVWKGSDKGKGPIQVGESRISGQDLCKICDTSAFRIGVWINESDIGRVHLGQHATIKMSAFQGREFEAVVAELGVVAVDKNNALSSLALKSTGEAFVNVVEAKLDFVSLAEEDCQAMRINYTAEVDIQADPVARTEVSHPSSRQKDGGPNLQSAEREAVK